MTGLPDLLRQLIRQNGGLSVQDYWTLCQSHPQFGYYMKHDPFGSRGDFVTAPEISQMFGELIGIWIADLWLKMKQPARFLLVECGAGRGTMMDDMLRATRNVPGLHQAAQIHIVETSLHLQELQRQKLGAYKVSWSKTLDDLPTDVPMVILGNEFFDALPIRQVIRTDAGWHERMVGMHGEGFAFGMGDVFPMAASVEAPPGTILEFSPIRDAVWAQMVDRLRKQGGAALMIDYGHAMTAFGDTFQALKDHEMCDVLSSPGDADLTSHVDFGRLADQARDLNPRLATQGDFLDRLGLDTRVKSLLKVATPAQAEEIKAGQARLSSPDQMGELFKVLSICSPASIEPAGFS